MTAHPSDQSAPDETTDPQSSTPEPETPTEAAAPAEPEAAPDAEAPEAPDAAAEPEAPEAAAEPEAAAGDVPAADAPAEGGGKKKRKKGKGGGQAEGGQPAAKQEQPKKPAGPDPVAITKQIGRTSEAALAYVKDPDPKLARMARKHREAVITEIPPVTAGALLGPDALCRHFLASAASGRYRDLFFLWDLFVLFPEECKPVLASRQRAQEKARQKLQTATHLGLLGSSDRVAEDIDRATGLPWRWLKEILEPMGPAIVQRPAVLAAYLRRVPDADLSVPEEPSDRWLAEAAALKDSGADVPEPIDALLGAHADRLPATVATLSMAHEQYPDRVPALIDRVDLGAPDVAAMIRWARDHGHGDQLVGRVAAEVESAAAVDRATGLATWKRWQDRGVDVAMPESLAAPTLDGLDLGKPESAELIKVLVDGGADLDPQQILDDVAAGNRMLGEKAFEAFVCAGFDDVHLPLALEGNPMVRPETRCPACQAWTWVRPGLEKRCPREGCPLRSGLLTPEVTAAQAEADVDAAVAALAPVVEAPAVDAPAAAAAPRPAATPPPPPAAAAPAEAPATAPAGASPEAPATAPAAEPEAPADASPEAPADGDAPQA